MSGLHEKSPIRSPVITIFDRRAHFLHSETRHPFMLGQTSLGPLPVSDSATQCSQGSPFLGDTGLTCKKTLAQELSISVLNSGLRFCFSNVFPSQRKEGRNANMHLLSSPIFFLALPPSLHTARTAHNGKSHHVITTA